MLFTLSIFCAMVIMERFLMKKELISILTSPLTSLKKEGKFARKLLWEHARSVVYYEVYSESYKFLSKLVQISLVGLVFSFFEEKTIIEWIKTHWVLVVSVLAAYTFIDRIVEVVSKISRDKGRGRIELYIVSIIWQKSQDVGIGTRLSSEFQEKLRTARRCNFYDFKSVGLWPIEVISSVCSSVTMLGTLAFLNWRIGIIFLVTSILVSLVAAYMSRWVREKEKSLQETESRADEYPHASLSVDSTLLGTSRMLFGRAIELRTSLLDQRTSFTRKGMLVTTIVGSITLVVVGIQLWLARESLFESMTIMKIGVTVSTMGMAIGTFTDTMRTLFGDQSSIADIRELQEFIEYPDSEFDKNNTSFSFGEGEHIRVVDAHFAYPYSEKSPQVFQGLSLDFIPGEAVAVVGANGSGKTTLGYVLLNIHRPQRGSIEYGSSSIGDYTVRSVLEHALAIPQSGDLPDLPLCESLFGTSDVSTLDKKRYDKALGMSGAQEVLDELPNGIYTQIGTIFEGGTKISGGQEQRLRLAAFFYKALDPLIRFVVADEPSRYLDPETRALVYAELIDLARKHNKIVLVISHDAELEQFDRVLVLKKGKVIGDHRGAAICQAVGGISKQLAGDQAVPQ